MSRCGSAASHVLVMPIGPKTLAKVLAVLLAVAVTVAVPAVQALFAAPGSHERPAGCHERTGQVPTPGPVSYQCCRAGHHAAIVQPLSASRPVTLYVAPATISGQFLTSASAVAGARDRLTESGDPPGALPLRI